MTQRLDARRQFRVVQDEPGVFFQRPQTLTRSIRTGIENTIGRLLQFVGHEP